MVQKVKLDTIQQRKHKIVATFRISRQKLKRFKEVCLANNTQYSKITEILVSKFLRGEIIILSKDFEK